MNTEQAKTPDRYLTVKEVAERLRKSTWSISEMCKKGIIRAIKPGRTYRIKESDFEAYVEGISNVNKTAD